MICSTIDSWCSISWLESITSGKTSKINQNSEICIHLCIHNNIYISLLVQLKLCIWRQNLLKSVVCVTNYIAERQLAFKTKCLELVDPRKPHAVCASTMGTVVSVGSNSICNGGKFKGQHYFITLLLYFSSKEKIINFKQVLFHVQGS